MTALVALDVDGTLLDPSSQLPPRRVEALAALQAAGVEVVLVTGKTWPSIRHIWDACGLEGPHVCCNGSAVVTRHGDLLSVSPLDGDLVGTVTAELLARDIAYAAYLDDGTSVTARDHPDLRVIAGVGEALPAVDEPGDRRVLKVLSVVREDAEAGLRSLADGAARVQRTSPHFLEWNAAGADKGTGLTFVADRLGVPLGNAVAIGDAESDLPMFAVAGTSVAVNGASPAAVDAADLHLRDRDLTDYLFDLAR